jgi:ion channel-forming bestrophin family protein
MNRNSVHIPANREELPGFLPSALMWRGSVTPRILPGVILASLYTLLLAAVDSNWHRLPYLEVTPFEYTGAVLGLVLVFRTNSGHERWWEARKLWGGVVNQCRNLLIMALCYGPDDIKWRESIVKWVIVFPYSLKESLRNERNFMDINELLTEQEMSDLQSSQHMPIYVAKMIAILLEQALSQKGIDKFVFSEVEKHRSALIDYAGGCERILKTPMPLVYAIKARRFILIFLILLPFSLIERAGLLSAFIALLVAYPLLSLDRIGLELQNPFSIKNLSHLPLDLICDTIKANGLALLESEKADQNQFPPPKIVKNQTR